MGKRARSRRQLKSDRAGFMIAQFPVGNHTEER
jgi:hypothetical protein